jgi:CelD/BcsL family acetyltransferase involved in cellulose biosynthesis
MREHSGGNEALSWRIVATPEDWTAAEAAWHALERRGARTGLFQAYDWLDAWWRAVAADPFPSRRLALRGRRERRLRCDRGRAHGSRSPRRDRRALAQHDRVFAPVARDLPARRAGAGRPHVSMIEAAGRPIAAHLGFVDADRCYYYAPACDPEFRDFSPGHLLMFELLRHACAMRVPAFDLLRGDYAYKWRLTDTAVDLEAYAAPITSIGRLRLGLHAMLPCRRRRTGGPNSPEGG